MVHIGIPVPHGESPTPPRADADDGYDSENCSTAASEAENPGEVEKEDEEAGRPAGRRSVRLTDPATNRPMSS